MRFEKSQYDITMAKRKNTNARTRKVDPSDDQTVIKLTTPKKTSKEKTNSRAKTTNKKNTATSKSTSSKSRSANPRKTTRGASNKKNTADTTKSTKVNESNASKTSASKEQTSVKAGTPTPTISLESVKISQSVAILIDGNNIEMSLTKLTNNKSAVLNFDTVIPKLLHGRGLNRLIYFREGRSISKKLADRLHTHYFGSVVPCHKSADIPLSIQATQLAEKVDTIIILSGDSDYVELVRHVKSKGVRVEIAAIEITTANILKEEADYYSPITKEDAFIMK